MALERVASHQKIVKLAKIEVVLFLLVENTAVKGHYEEIYLIYIPGMASDTTILKYPIFRLCDHCPNRHKKQPWTGTGHPLSSSTLLKP